MNLRLEVSWLGKERMLEHRGTLPEEDGNQLREYKAMHEEQTF